MNKNLKIINQGFETELVKFFDKKENDSNYMLLYNRFGWDILLINKFYIEILNQLKISKIIESYNEHQILINFVSVYPSNEDIKTYFKILDYRREVELFLVRSY